MSMYQNMAQMQALSQGVHPNFIGTRGRPGIQHLNIQHPGLPDIDVDVSNGECNLSSIGEIIEIGGKSITVMALDMYRYIVYDKQIQHIRNVESFLNYHKKNTGSLEHLMTNLVWAQLLPDSKLENMYSSGRNHDHTRLRYPTSMWSTKEVPLKPLLEKTQRWLQGIIIEAHGIQGLDLIKQAKEKAADKLRITEKSEEELNELLMKGSGVGLELNKPLKDTVEDIMEDIGINMMTDFHAGHSAAYGYAGEVYGKMLSGLGLSNNYVEPLVRQQMGIPHDTDAYVGIAKKLAELGSKQKTVKAVVMHGDVPNQNRTVFPAKGVHMFIDPDGTFASSNTLDVINDTKKLLKDRDGLEIPVIK